MGQSSHPCAAVPPVWLFFDFADGWWADVPCGLMTYRATKNVATAKRKMRTVRTTGTLRARWPPERAQVETAIVSHFPQACNGPPGEWQVRVSAQRWAAARDVPNLQE